MRLWDNRSSSSEPMSEVIVGGKVTSLDLSRDLNYLAVCSRDDKIKVNQDSLVSNKEAIKFEQLVNYFFQWCVREGLKKSWGSWAVVTSREASKLKMLQ